QDGSTPERLTLEQVWAEPNGRVQVLDFLLSGPVGRVGSSRPDGEQDVGSRRPDPTYENDAGAPSADSRPRTPQSLSLLRQGAALRREGRPGADGGPVRAPVPPHAAPILAKLFRPDGYRSLAEVHKDLADTHAHTPEVTGAVRTAQLGVQAAVLSAGLVL